MVLISEKIGFIGAGMMAEALAKGFINKGVITAAQVYSHDPSTTRQEVFRSFGATACKSGSEVSNCSIFVGLCSAIQASFACLHEAVSADRVVRKFVTLLRTPRSSTLGGRVHRIVH
jgi:pyrroline-5-carboxylate reductase